MCEKERKMASECIVDEVSKEFGITLKQQQREAIDLFLKGKDMFYCLPTGYWKSMCYSLLPRMLLRIFDCCRCLPGTSVFLHWLPSWWTKRRNSPIWELVQFCIPAPVTTFQSWNKNVCLIDQTPSPPSNLKKGWSLEMRLADNRVWKPAKQFSVHFYTWCT